MKYISILFILLLSGCAEFTALKTSIGSYGSEVADDSLNTAIWTICNGSSVGAVERKFQTEEQQKAREVICAIP